jgi:predicted dehydrogenase
LKKNIPKINELSCIVIGCGSIGERHLNNIQKLGIKKIGIFDIDKKKAQDISEKYNVRNIININSIFDFKPSFTVICTFPWTHQKFMKLSIDANCHIFVEKPLSSNLEGIENILKYAKSKKLKIAVGHNLRFEEGLKIIKKKMEKNQIGKPLNILSQCGQHIKLWRPHLNYKNHYVLKKGGGIILDDSHEYDYIRWLLNDKVESVVCFTKKAKSIRTNTESLASIMLKFKKGSTATLVIDYLRPKYERNCQIIGENGSIKWNLEVEKGASKNYSAKIKSKIETHVLQSNKISKETVSKKQNSMYVEEMKDFVDSIRYNKKPFVDGWDSLETLKIGIAALKSANENRVIKI